MTIRFQIEEEGREHFSKVATALWRSKRCVVVTGAGISVSGGIPDFRSADGLYNLVKEKYPNAIVKGKDLFDATLFKDPVSTSLFYTFMAELKQVINQANTTPTHHFVKDLDERGQLLRCYTQNIDCLELRLQMSCDLSNKQSARIVQLHGDLDHVVCTICQAMFDFSDTFRDDFKEGGPPSCPTCVEMEGVRIAAGKRPLPIGTLRPNIVLYNEHHSRGDQIADMTAYDVKKRPDMLIVMGTSLKVVGIKRLVKDLAKSVHELRNGQVVFINNTEIGHKEWDDVFDYHILGKTDDVVAELEQEMKRLDVIAQLRAQKLARAREQKELASFVERDPTRDLQLPIMANNESGVDRLVEVGTTDLSAGALMSKPSQSASSKATLGKSSRKPSKPTKTRATPKTAKGKESSSSGKTKAACPDILSFMQVKKPQGCTDNKSVTLDPPRGRCDASANRDRSTTPTGRESTSPPQSPSKRGAKSAPGSPSKKQKMVVEVEEEDSSVPPLIREESVADEETCMPPILLTVPPKTKPPRQPRKKPAAKKPPAKKKPAVTQQLPITCTLKTVKPRNTLTSIVAGKPDVDSPPPLCVRKSARLLAKT
ncbi:uncharacterized protein SPPG_00465 [Spizellomyces punctatus DAOM BR117]|uniref:Deacetylase sirtuin-type domain-containing protein n=1 Tax=Spizellomyces punctatus (strain DAOM BR117) TaxID=645134 RepID=A0A0L0HTT9_SPIPD|nr:uncharacterized protein SPPG_00465 [Spizellomyces punctatus DAOM BR117]KND04761.1 hypothetical protein SPPG_00465 [Spizellomyces punctatus DAOM BR117]|eukprot:XP_016612800.1 hypothetical protein SPPG_00465 [Spizellomyces punctatus DAOM BR117]